MKRDLKTFMRGETVNSDAQETMEKYGSKNDDELMSELNALKESGVVNNQELLKMAKTIGPMLNESQRKKLDDLIVKLMD
ncbi:MAG: hypothetical protein IJF80_04405 [Clostridia bacterium]|nr:hypothetical protein [Clostridia bacterium]